MMIIMAIPVVEISREGYKMRGFWLKINICTQRKSLNFENFENWSSGELSKIGHNFRKKSYLKIDVCNQKMSIFKK